MANKYNAGTNTKITAMITGITAAIGNSLELDFSFSPGYKIVLDVGPDGNSLAVTASSHDQGPNNPFGAVVDGHNIRATAFKVRGDQMP